VEKVIRMERRHLSWQRGGSVACAADEPIISALVAVGSERSNALQLYQLLQSEAL
jgi:hypothetical protein